MDIKLSKNDKSYIEGANDVYTIMQRILLRENKIDQVKEHFWIIGLNQGCHILYIELIALGSYRAVDVEPMNVFRVAVMKNASRVIAIHNHPSGTLTASDADKDITDRLIQVGRILDIELVDHLIITPQTYMSFRAFKLMDELEKSLKYVPTYQVIEQIRKEEKKIAKEKLAVANDKIKTAEEKAKIAKLAVKKEREQKERLVHALNQKEISADQIAIIMEIEVKNVQKILKKKT